MAALMRFLVGAPGTRTPPPAQDSDIVYPVHMLDDSKTLRNIVVAWTLRFDDVLDADKLRVSLSQLLEISDWKKLGGRLRLKVACFWSFSPKKQPLTFVRQENGGLEIHVPPVFTIDRPAVHFTHGRLSMGIEDHPQAKMLPKPTADPLI